MGRQERPETHRLNDVYGCLHAFTARIIGVNQDIFWTNPESQVGWSPVTRGGGPRIGDIQAKGLLSEYRPAILDFTPAFDEIHSRGTYEGSNEFVLWSLIDYARAVDLPYRPSV